MVKGTLPPSAAKLGLLRGAEQEEGGASFPREQIGGENEKQGKEMVNLSLVREPGGNHSLTFQPGFRNFSS